MDTPRCILGKQRSSVGLLPTKIPRWPIYTRLTGVPRDLLRITAGALPATSR